MLKAKQKTLDWVGIKIILNFWIHQWYCKRIIIIISWWLMACRMLKEEESGRPPSRVE